MSNNLMKFKVTYTQDGNRVIEYCKTKAWAKKRAQQVNGTWSKLEAGE